MKDLKLKIYDDHKNIIYEQVMYNTDDVVVDTHARKLKEFFKANNYATFDLAEPRKEASKPEVAQGEMKEFIYLEDNQMYYTIPFVFETNAPYSISEFTNISYEPPGAGRMSTGSKTFKRLVEERGYKVNLIKELPKGKAPKGYKVITGATGNY